MCRFDITTICLLILATSQAQVVSRNRSGCVATFWTERKKFDKCRTHLCFIFKFDQPFVFDNEKLEKQPSHPFRCRARKRLYPGLDGLFFDVLDGVSLREDQKASPNVRDAYCIYSGSDSCTFDGEVQFLNEAARNDSRYMFIVGGYLNFMPNRRTNNAIQSAQTVTDSMVLMHRRNPATRSFQAAVTNVFEPFEWSGWLVAFGFALLIILVIGLYVQWFSNTSAHIQPNIFIWLINGVPLVTPEQRAAWRLLVLTVTVMATVVVILYELAVALSIFRGPGPIVSALWQLTGLGLTKFVVTKGGASESTLRIVVDKQGKLNGSNFPWKRMNRMDDMITALLTEKSDVEYIFAFEKNIKFFLHKRKLCNSVSVTPLNLKTVGGWYYSTAVPMLVRTRIDKMLQHMWISQEAINNVNRFQEVPIDCGASYTKVDHSILFILLGVSVGPLLLITICFMIKARQSRPKSTTQSSMSGTSSNTNVVKTP